MDEAGYIRQVKTRGDESDARVLSANLSGGGRLKRILTRRPSAVLTIDFLPKGKRKKGTTPLGHRTLSPNQHQQILEFKLCTPDRADFTSNPAPILPGFML